MSDPAQEATGYAAEGPAPAGTQALPQLLLFLTQVCVYVLATVPCVPLVGWLASRLGLAGWALGIGLGFHVWGIAMMLIVAALRFTVGGTIRPGTYPLSSREARRWLRDLALCEIATRSPFFICVHHYPLLAAFFYRLMGAKVAWRVRIGYGARLTDPWLTRIERGATIGERALLLGHFIEGTSVVLREVAVGAHATVGVMAVISPGCRVEAGATLGACSMLPKGRRVPEGELWAGVPARRLRPAQRETPPGGDGVVAEQGSLSSTPRPVGGEAVAGRSYHGQAPEDCGGC